MPIKNGFAAVLLVIILSLFLLTALLDKHTDLLENRLLPSVTYTENTIKVYSDMYKMNNDNMKRLEKRTKVLEDDAGVEVPEELTLKELPDLPAQ